MLVQTSQSVNERVCPAPLPCGSFARAPGSMGSVGGRRPASLGARTRAAACLERFPCGWLCSACGVPYLKTLVLSVVRRPRTCSRRRRRCGLARRPPCRSTCTAAHRRARCGGLQGARAAALARPIAPPAAAPSGKLRQGRAGGRRAHGRRARRRAERRRGKRAAAPALRGRRRGAGAVRAAAGARKECSKCLGGRGGGGSFLYIRKAFEQRVTRAAHWLLNGDPGPRERRDRLCWLRAATAGRHIGAPPAPNRRGARAGAPPAPAHQACDLLWARTALLRG